MKQLTEFPTTDLAQITQKGQYVLFFHADWCPDCKFIEPEMQSIEEDFPEYHFISVDRDQFLDLAKKLNIMGIPSFVAYADGQEIGRLVNKNRKTKAEVEAFLKSLA